MSLFLVTKEKVEEMEAAPATVADNLKSFFEAVMFRNGHNMKGDMVLVFNINNPDDPDRERIMYSQSGISPERVLFLLKMAESIVLQ